MSQSDHISRKKEHFPIQEPLRDYLVKYNREVSIDVKYSDLLRAERSYPLTDKNGKDTLWERMFYQQNVHRELNEGLTRIYAHLKTEGELSVTKHLFVDRIEYCTFGNSNPFRIRIVNQYNDNYDYFYVKRADASRIYGLELEHILSPNRIIYFTDHDTLIEEHIIGIPGDQFIADYLSLPHLNKVRIAKEFIKFNERCFVRLLGDMRSYNYVVDMIQDFESEQYRIRAIDFDQQSYEGRINLYKPQFFKNNLAMVQLCMELLNTDSAKQYQYEERTLMTRRLVASQRRIRELLGCLREDTISTDEKIRELRKELALLHQKKEFEQCRNMGDLLVLHLQCCLHIEKVSI
ncbi:MAG: hypothetical protein H6585_12350 [Flavobacteriales bacterium]|nr:hypothetical protein [Flavobacteriales bacterium]MCB9449121.1 hypothetical protein [Flavobacteriales bacterium]